tara:strand:+ start:104 stop:517 length:414 start_codon:yes stop_codon:yes gene_type:complete
VIAPTSIDGAAKLFYQAKINTGDLMKKVFREYIQRTWEENPNQFPGNNGVHRFVLGKPDSATLVEFWIDESERKFTTTTYEWLDTLLDVQSLPCEDDVTYVNFNVPSFVGPAILLRDKAKAVESWKEMTAVGYERFL